MDTTKSPEAIDQDRRPAFQVAATPTSDAIRPFRVDVPEEALVDLRPASGGRRGLAREGETVADQSQGVPLKTGPASFCTTGRPTTTWRKVEGAASTPLPTVRHPKSMGWTSTSFMSVHSKSMKMRFCRSS